MKKAFYSLVTALIMVQLPLLLGVAKVSAAGAVVIAELQTGSSSNASSEYVKIANISSVTVDLTGWLLKSTPAAGNPAIPADQTKRAALSGLLAPGASLLIVSSNYQTDEPHQSMSSGLVADGHVELVDKSGSLQDVVGWGVATHPEASPAPKPVGGQSLVRKTNSSGRYIDTDNNQNDFSLGSLPVAPVPSPTPGTTNPETNATLDFPVITELLPNPAAPKTDDKDEYVELYNPNEVAFALKGFKLQTGSTFPYSMTFNDQILPAQGYAVFTSGGTSLTLSNTAGAARLLDPSGAVVSQTDRYGIAGEGQAWALGSGTWQWTSTPSPGADNVFSAVLAASTSSPSSKAKATPSAKPTTTSKSTVAKSAKSGAKTTASGATGPGSQKSSDVKQPSPLHPLILAGVGGLAVAYGVYEYRHDIQNAITKLKRYRTNRRENRKSA